MKEVENQLQQRWFEFWQRVGVRRETELFFKDLVIRYSESHRAYHTLKHIKHCLTELDQVGDLVKNLEAMEAAIWYHDIIYDRATNNEERSVDFAVYAISEMGLDPGFATKVSGLILATKHLGDAADNDGKLLADIDIAIFGQAPHLFDQYEDEIRSEYGYVDDVTFASGRMMVMKLFSDREKIFSTDIFRNKYEEIARNNLERSLKRWNRENFGKIPSDINNL